MHHQRDEVTQELSKKLRTSYIYETVNMKRSLKNLVYGERFKKQTIQKCGINHTVLNGMITNPIMPEADLSQNSVQMSVTNTSNE